MSDPLLIDLRSRAGLFESRDSFPMALTMWPFAAKPYQERIAIRNGTVHRQQRNR